MYMKPIEILSRFPFSVTLNNNDDVHVDDVYVDIDNNQCSHQAAPLQDSRKKNRNGALKAMHCTHLSAQGCYERKRLLEVQYSSLVMVPMNTPALCFLN